LQNNPAPHAKSAVQLEPEPTEGHLPLVQVAEETNDPKKHVSEGVTKLSVPHESPGRKGATVVWQVVAGQLLG
jgi:hypothetical protein